MSKSCWPENWNYVLASVRDGNNNDGPDQDSNPSPLNLLSGALQTELSDAGFWTSLTVTFFPLKWSLSSKMTPGSSPGKSSPVSSKGWHGTKYNRMGN